MNFKFIAQVHHLFWNLKQKIPFGKDVTSVVQQSLIFCNYTFNSSRQLQLKHHEEFMQDYDKELKEGLKRMDMHKAHIPSSA